MTIRVWNFDHFNRSMRAGISVLIVDVSLVVASLLTVRPLHERIRQCVETSPLGQRRNVLLSAEKNINISREFPDHRFEIS
jgi:predicted lysophospholipase L1 biosynthesis ABC-type transport system permease subunit